MKFILYSHFTEDVIQNHLGERDAGYCFVLRAFRRVLRDLGSIEVVRDPETEVGPIFEECRARREFCVFLPFAPPHKAPLDLECPTVPVIAWGFSTIPDETWGDDARNDWRLALAKVGRAITLSRYSAQVFAGTMGADFMIAVVPAPIRNRMSDAFPSEPVTAGLEIEAAGRILDTAAMQLEVDILAPARPGSDGSEPIKGYQRSTTSDRAGVGLASKLPARLSPGGVVYTSVLNPNDGRTNSRDIVTAFCWALRDMADATLVLKVCNSGLPAFYSALIPILYKLSPFKCRVLVLPRFLEDYDYDKLIRATTYYVNASTSEGWCTPLMEFMSCGKPAIAPTHTAMADYIDRAVAFVLRASPQIATWPEDPRQVFRTLSFRLDWESLLQAYQQSYRLAKATPDAYCEMSRQARNRMRRYASPEIVSEKLNRLFSSLAASTADRSHSPDPTSEDFTGRR